MESVADWEDRVNTVARAALIAVGVGAAGPLVIIPLAEGVTRAAKAFFKSE